jgi:hypothetical protein
MPRQPSATQKTTTPVRLGGVFLNVCAKFSQYTVYVNNFDKSVRLLRQLEAAHPILKSVMQVCEHCCYMPVPACANRPVHGLSLRHGLAC